MNLVLNARDASTGAGRVVIATSLVRHRSDGSKELPDGLEPREYVRLTVSDTGAGMDDATRGRAFDPFFTSKAVDEGTGLGLSVVYGIVSQANGHVRVESEPGKGARFEIFWPRSSERAIEAQPPRSTRDRSSRGDERILLVEDERELRLVLKRLLTACGYQVLASGDPESALAIAEADRDRIDALVTDVVMPGMNGLDLAEAVCSLHPETRVLLISGHMVLDSSIETALPAGVAFLAKPFDPHDLTGKVREILDAQVTRNEDAAGPPPEKAPA